MAKHWHNQEWSVLELSAERRSIVGPDHRCLETTLHTGHAKEICSFVNRVYTLGMKRGRMSVFREQKEAQAKKQSPKASKRKEQASG